MYEFDIHPEAKKEFRRLNDVNGGATRESSFGVGEALGHIVEWVTEGIPDEKYWVSEEDGIKVYPEGDNAVLAFFATKEGQLVLVYIGLNGTLDEQDQAKEEAKRRAKEWFS